jgi:uncharacterized protein YpbB
MKIKKIPVDKIDTYTITQWLLSEWFKIEQIAEKRGVTVQTIETHLMKLYEHNKIPLQDILKQFDLSVLKQVKEIITNNNLWNERLWVIKDACWENISYSDIRITLFLIEKQDL